ncbi:hypothetical protein Snas_6357 [Stackebrandtia nassauensis DSM 44728]|uniref:Uncharacterized protein n=2 Tax=Stackebrandtia TaxID=283810 RepID=D3Q488_STANL|nr:hypothetical protein Snas_6357 [Stackebrandtia nassauensis DSM 44728]
MACMTEGSQEQAETDDAPIPAPKRRWPVVAGVVVMLLVLCLVAYLGGWFASKPDPGGSQPSAEVSAEDMEIDFDLKSAAFYLPPDNRPYYLYGDKYRFDLDDREPAVEPVRFTDGLYYPTEGDSGDEPHMRLAEGTKPIFTDVNGDSNTDVVATLEFTGTPEKRYTAWKGVFIWLWNDGKVVPVKHPAAWQWMDCPGESDLTVKRDGLSGLPLVTRSGDGNCDGEKNDSQGENPPPQTVFVQDGVPVSIGHATSAVDRCYFFDMYKKDANYVVTKEVPVRLAPDPDAAEIDGTVLVPGEGGKVTDTGEKQTIDRIELRIGKKPDKKLYDGWIPANLVWSGANEPISCGWVNWDDIGKKLKKE